MNISAILAKHGIELRNQAGGNRKTVCPRCSHTRKNRRDPCLSVLIEAGGIAWKCHNCGWGGRDNGDGVAEPMAVPRISKAERNHVAGERWRNANRMGW